MKKSFIIIAIVSAFALTACGTKDLVPSKIVDENQVTSQSNATMNARRYRAEVFPDATQAIMQSDSTISPSCRFGDGWASGRIVKDGRDIVKIKCQTAGTGKGTFGCMTDAEFEKKEYAKQDGKCDTTMTELDKFK